MITIFLTITAVKPYKVPNTESSAKEMSKDVVGKPDATGNKDTVVRKKDTALGEDESAVPDNEGDANILRKDGRRLDGQGPKRYILVYTAMKGSDH